MSSRPPAPSKELPASLIRSLHLGSGQTGPVETSSLRNVRDRIDQFLCDAAAAPPAKCIEGDSDDDAAAMDEHEVHLAVVAGVLEARKAPRLQRVDNVALPTEANEKLLEAEKMRDSEALLSMFAALTNPASQSNGVPSRKLERRHRVKQDDGACGTECPNGDGGDDAASSSSSECVYMNASDCSTDSAASGSDDKGGAVDGTMGRRWVTEMPPQ